MGLCLVAHHKPVELSDVNFSYWRVRLREFQKEVIGRIEVFNLNLVRKGLPADLDPVEQDYFSLLK
jgi:hypothetical protein